MATMLLMKYRDRFDEDIVHRLEPHPEERRGRDGPDHRVARAVADQDASQKSRSAVEVAPMLADLGDLFENDLREPRSRRSPRRRSPSCSARARGCGRCSRTSSTTRSSTWRRYAPQAGGRAPVREASVSVATRRGGVQRPRHWHRDRSSEDLDKVSRLPPRPRRRAGSVGKGRGAGEREEHRRDGQRHDLAESAAWAGSTFRFTIKRAVRAAPAAGRAGRAA